MWVGGVESELRDHITRVFFYGIQVSDKVIGHGTKVTELPLRSPVHVCYSRVDYASEELLEGQIRFVRVHHLPLTRSVEYSSVVVVHSFIDVGRDQSLPRISAAQANKAVIILVIVKQIQ